MQSSPKEPENPINQNSGYNCAYLCESYGIKNLKQLEEALNASPKARDFKRRQLVQYAIDAKERLEKFDREV